MEEKEVRSRMAARADLLSTLLWVSHHKLSFEESSALIATLTEEEPWMLWLKLRQRKEREETT